MDPEGITCVHAATGLCDACREEYESDPLAWLEYGDHPAGLANWRELQEDMAAEAAGPPAPPADPDDIPF